MPVGRVSPPPELLGRTFVAMSLSVDGEPRPVVSGSRVTMTFEESMVSVETGCNALGVRVRISDDTVLSKAITQTDMGCDSPLTRQERWLAHFVDDDPRYALASDRLTLTADDRVIELASESRTESGLVDTDWVLTGIVHGAGPDATVGSVPVDIDSTVEFTDSGLHLDPAGCNQGSATIDLGGDAFTVRRTAATEMGCSGGDLAVERAVFDVLLRSDTEVAYRIDDDRLTVSRGEAGLVYRAD